MIATLRKYKYNINNTKTKLQIMENYRSLRSQEWALRNVFKQIKHCHERGYMNIDVEQETGELILYENFAEYHKLKKLMMKIMKEKTFEDEKKQFAIRRVCKDIVQIIS